MLVRNEGTDPKSFLCPSAQEDNEMSLDKIAEYAWTSYNSHEPGRERKLLLNRKELNKLQRKVKESGLTIITLRVFIGDNGYAKIEIALAKGRKEYDKREVIKRKDAQRQLDRLKTIK